MFETLGQDLRYAGRTLRKAPAFAGAIIVTLAIGIGANTAIFSLLNAVVLADLPVPAPGDLSLVQQSLPAITDAAPGQSNLNDMFSYPAFIHMKEALPPGTSLAAATVGVVRPNVRFEGDGDLTATTMQLVSGSFFATMGIAPVAGRLLTEEDAVTIDGHPVVVLREAIATREFGGPAAALGRTVAINDVPLTVVGVSPDTFPGIWLAPAVDLWVPAMMQHAVAYRSNTTTSQAEDEQPWIPQTGIEWLHVILRAPEGLEPQARAAMSVTYRNDARAEFTRRGTPDAATRQLLTSDLTLTPFAGGFSDAREQFSRALTLLMGMVGVLLVIGCANVANLLLGRAAARRQEIAIRLAIGAGRGRVVRQLLVECALLGAVSTAIALPLARWASTAMAEMAVVRNALSSGFALDPRVLLFTTAISLAAVALFGLWPALRATQAAPLQALRGSGRTASSHAGSMRPLVVAQVALSVVLVAAAALLARSLFNLSNVDTGFDREQLVSIRLTTPDDSVFTPERQTQLRAALLERIQRVPGVRAADVSYTGTAAGSRRMSGLVVDGYTPAADEEVIFQENLIGPGYFEATGMPLREGRAFTERDTASSPKVAIVNEAAVRRYFGGQSPLGRRMGEDAPDMEIVGVIADARVSGLRTPPRPMAFYPLAQHDDFAGYLDVRTSGDPRVVGAAVRQAILDVDPRIRVGTATPVSDSLQRGINRDRLMAYVAAAFGAVALLLACLGVYGVLSYGVTRRRQELGVRSALGATPAELRRLVLGSGMTMVALGIGAGALGIGAVARVMSTLLFGIEPLDLLTHGAVAAALIVVGFLACFVPAQRAARIDPVKALRSE